MSQAVIGNLLVKMALDTAAFVAGAAQAQKSASGLFGSLRTLAVTAATAATAALGTLTVAVGVSVNRMDDLGKAAQKVGIPVDEFSKLEYAARLSDVSLEGLTTALGRFSRNLAEISGGANNDASAAINAMGISALDANGKLRPTTEILKDVADEMSVMRDSAGKTALAVALFGKSGADLIPLMNGGRQAIADAAAQAEAFGTVVSEEAAVAAENFNDNMTRLIESVSGVAQQVTIGMLPAMTDATNSMVAFSEKGEIARNITDAMSWIVKEAARVVLYLSQAFAEASAYATFFGSALDRISTGDFAGIADDWGVAMERVDKAVAATKESLKQLNDEGQRSTSWLKGDLPSAARTKDAPVISTGGTKPTTSSVPKIPPDTIDSIYGAGEAFSDMWARMSEGIPQANEFQTACMSIADTMSNSLGSSIEGLITGTMDLKDVFKSMSGSITQELTQLSAQLAKSSFLKVISMLAGKMFGGVTLGGMSFGGFYANGGTLGAGQWGIAGEAGPEIVHGPARVTPMNKAQAPVIVKHTVLNYGGAKIEQQERTGANGERELLTIIDRRMASQMSDPYSPASSALDARGARIAKKRR